MRTPFLVDVPATESREAESGRRARLVTNTDKFFASSFVLQDDPDDDYDEDDDVDNDDDEDDDEDEDDDDDVETWQVAEDAVALKFSLSLTSGTDLPRLARISS
jgi:hypothetical protein